MASDWHGKLPAFGVMQAQLLLDRYALGAPWAVQSAFVLRLAQGNYTGMDKAAEKTLNQWLANEARRKTAPDRVFDIVTALHIDADLIVWAIAVIVDAPAPRLPDLSALGHRA